MPQAIYYFWCIHQIDLQKKICISVPSGNYGNIASGMLAKKMLAIQDRIKFIVASNANDVVPKYLETGKYSPQKTIKTYSNAMDVGNPSNFPRILEIYGKSYENLVNEVYGQSVDDELTITTIKKCYSNNNYILEPHGATGFHSLKKYVKSDEVGVFLETAHPCKFLPVMQKAIPDYKIPSFADELMKKEKQSYKISADFETFKEYLVYQI